MKSAWQLTSVLRRLRLWTAVPAPAHPGLAGTGLPAGLDRARRSGHPPVAVERLGDRLAGMDATARHRVLAPLDLPLGATVRWAGAPACQHDPTTCGSAVLGMLAAAGDPALALWLETGVDVRRDDVPPDATGAERFARLQAALKRRTSRRALLGLPWPSALGTPPWTAAREARHADVRYGHMIVDDRSPEQAGPVLAAVRSAVTAGVPVPLFTGGDASTGLATAVPRHVVLATGAGADGLRVYEPSSARILGVRADALTHPGDRVEAFGGWRHVAWALLPVSRS